MNREFVASMAFLVFVLLVVIAVIVLKLPDDSPVVPAPTPMDMIIRMRNSKGEIDQEWKCHFEDKKGWLCDPIDGE